MSDTLEWLNQKAAIEDENTVSVGGLVTRLEVLPCGHDAKWRIGKPDDPGATIYCDACRLIATERDTGLRLQEACDNLADENAELRRWLGAAANSLESGDGFPDIFDHIRALSRGEEIAQEVRRMYLGDEEP